MAASLDRLTLVVANIVSVGLGLVGGYLLAKPKPCELSAGNLFVVGENTYVDAPFVGSSGFLVERQQFTPQWHEDTGLIRRGESRSRF